MAEGCNIKRIAEVSKVGPDRYYLDPSKSAITISVNLTIDNTELKKIMGQRMTKEELIKLLDKY